MTEPTRIQKLNDQFRKSLLDPHGPTGGLVVLTQGVDALDPEVKRGILTRVATFKKFTPDNDPYKEHDFGNFRYLNHHVYFKIDYFATDYVHGSEQPDDAAQTRRVLTIMLSSEY